MKRRDFLKVTGVSASGVALAGCMSDGTTVEQISVDRGGLGESDAPTLFAFEDLGCPHCRDFHMNTLPLLKRDYIETGEIQYVFVDYVLPASQYSFVAHEFSKGVLDVGSVSQYFDFVDFVFSNQSGMDKQILKNGVFEVFDSEEDANVAITNAEEGRYKDAVESGRSLGSEYGVRGTPQFGIDGTLISDAGTYSALSGEIDRLIQ